MSSKKLEKQVHFVAEGHSVGCYDSKGSPVRYLMICGVPYIELVKSVDRLLDIETVAVHNVELEYYKNHVRDSVGFVHLAGVVNGTFVSSKNSHWRYAERKCSNRELASFYLAMYKALKNSAKSEDIKNEQR